MDWSYLYVAKRWCSFKICLILYASFSIMLNARFNHTSFWNECCHFAVFRNVISNIKLIQTKYKSIGNRYVSMLLVITKARNFKHICLESAYWKSDSIQIWFIVRILQIQKYLLHNFEYLVIFCTNLHV